MLNEFKLLNFIQDMYSEIDESFSLELAKLGTGKNYLLKKEGAVKYFVKFFDEESIYENLQDEIEANKILIANNFPTPHFLPNKDNNCVTKFNDSSSIIIQEWITGRTPEKFTLTLEQAKEAIKLLATANILLKQCSFKTMFLDLIKNIKKRKEETKAFVDLFISNKRENKIILNLLADKIKCFDILENFNLDMEKFTFVNSHGDYNCLQIMMNNNNEINYVVDFSRSSKVPAIWEIIRFYSFADPDCKDCKINKSYFLKLIKEYEKYIKLSEYDKKNAYLLYAIQILSSHFGYKQYIEKGSTNNVDFAIWRVNLAKALLNECGISI